MVPISWMALFFLGLFGGQVPGVSGDDATNGIFKGYLGSDRWFSEMRKTAANQALSQSLAGARGPRPLPPGTVECGGTILFPDGNPFPEKRCPDLRISCEDLAADGMERAPYLDEHGGFYTILKKGQTYNFFWMYYFGGREKIASVFIPLEGQTRRWLTLEYRPAPTATKPKPLETASPHETGAHTPPGGVALTTTEAEKFDLTGFPSKPTCLEEQQVLEEINFATDPALKSQAHKKLAGYYARKGDARRARLEEQKALFWHEKK